MFRDWMFGEEETQSEVPDTRRVTAEEQPLLYAHSELELSKESFSYTG